MTTPKKENNQPSAPLTETSNKAAAFSGGKDSTAMVLLMAERGDNFDLIFTPTGDENDECLAHVRKISEMTGKKLIAKSSGKTLYSLIEQWNALPNDRMRWCTRVLKIEPCKAYLLQHPDTILCVGLRADEEAREGMWGEFATYEYPLRAAGMGIQDVYDFLKDRSIVVPVRTDCRLCFYQRLIEWFELWRDFPETWKRGEELEAMTKHTFRSPSRDTWPASMKGLRESFEAGRIPKDTRRSRDGMCRVCSL